MFSKFPQLYEKGSLIAPLTVFNVPHFNDLGRGSPIHYMRNLDMSFEAFTELYINVVNSRLKENTGLTKEHIIRTKILSYFGKLKIGEISFNHAFY